MIIIQLAMHFLQKSSLNTDIQKKICNLPFLGQVFKSFFQYKKKKLPLPQFKLFIYLIYFLIFGCTGSSLLHEQSFSSCGEQGLLSGCCATRSCCSGCSCGRVRALGTQASAAAACGPSSCSTQAQLPRGTWDHSSGIKPVSPALEGKCLTTGPPEKFLSF